MQIEIITTIQELQEYEHVWNDVVDGSPCDSIFVTYEWFLSWIKHFNKCNNLTIVIARDNKRLLGILPLFKERVQARGHSYIALKSLANYESAACRYNIILANEGSLDILKAMIDFLNRSIDWDVMEMDFIPAGTNSIALLKEIEGVNYYKIYVDPMAQSPFIHITGTWEDYLQQRTKKIRRNLDYYEKRLDKEGDVEIVLVEGGDDLEYHILEALAIEKTSWKGDQGSAIVDSNEEKNFIIDLAKAMSKQGKFALYFLLFNGRKIAFDYCLKYKDTFHVLKTGYNPAYAKNSPGRVLRKKVLRSLYEDKRYKIYDFQGVLDEWKTEWTNEGQQLLQVTIYNKKIIPMIKYQYKFVSNAFKGMIRDRAFGRLLKSIRR
jgi:CelD/BcsL family acetyltransferase involved in cellulose biosynthesis